MELQYVRSKEIGCDKHKGDFDAIQRAKGLSGFAFFFLVILLPIAAAAGIGYWVYNHWDGKLGAIRLGDSSASRYSALGGTPSSVFDAERPWIKYPIVALSAVVAVVATTPLLIGSAFRWTRSLFGGGGATRRYTTRSDFARGGRYAVVDPDEDELLGADDDDVDMGATALPPGGGGGGGGTGGAGGGGRGRDPEGDV